MSFEDPTPHDVVRTILDPKYCFGGRHDWQDDGAGQLMPNGTIIMPLQCTRCHRGSTRRTPKGN